MSELEKKQMEANINSMIANVDMEEKKYVLEIVRLVLYGVVAGSVLTLALVKLLS